MTDKIFMEASRKRLMFSTPQGPLTVSDLWDLPLTSRAGRANLDDIARAFNRTLKSQEEESFVTKPPRKNKEMVLGFEIVKVVIATRLEENKAAKDAADKAKKKEKLLKILAKKQDEGLESMSEEDILKELEDL